MNNSSTNVEKKDSDKKLSDENNNNDGKKRAKRNNHSSSESDDDHKNDDYSSSSSSYHRRKKKKKKRRRKEGKKKKSKKHRKQRYYSSDESSDSEDDYSSTDDDESSSYDNRRKEKRRKRSRDRKKHKKSSHKKEKKKKRSPSPDVPTFGKYGIIQPSKDMKRKERSFQIWMAEVKVIPSFTGSKYELQEYFKEYAEDYNTATLPHTKYYDYDKWEMEEYKKKMEKENKRITSSKGGSKMLADEAKHRAEVHQRAVDKKESDMQFVRATVMNSDKLQDMKRQRDLQAELQHAFKTGDKEKVRKIKQKLEPD